MIANSVPAVLGFAVNGVSSNTEYLLLLHKRNIVSACTIPRGHGGCHFMGTGVAGVDAVVLVDQRLMPMFLCRSVPATSSEQSMTLPP